MDSTLEFEQAKKPRAQRQLEEDRAILSFILLCIEGGKPPSVVQIKKHLGFRSMGTTWRHLLRMEGRGWITRERGVHYGIGITEAGRDEANK